MPVRRAKTIGYGRQSIAAQDLRAVARVLRGQALTCGPAVEAFEAEIARISGAKHAVAVSNGTSALRLLYQAVGIGPKKLVGVPAITFIATASQAMLLGAEIVVLDVDPETLLLTPDILERWSGRLDYVVPVHVAGRMCDMRGLAAVAKRRDIIVLEDAAHAFGSSYRDGQRCGDCHYSAGATFSFHPVKNITTGEGGAVCTNSAKIADKIRQLRHHGIVRGGFTGDLAERDGGAPWYHEFHQPATNERLCDLQAALGVSQCRRLGAFKKARQRIHTFYRRVLAEHSWLRFPSLPADQDPCWHLCTAQVDWRRLGMDRRAFWQAAHKAGINLQVHYIPIHHQPVLRAAQRAGTLKGADVAYEGLVSLPCYPTLSRADLNRVVGFLRSVARPMRTFRQSRTANQERP
jgi:dTDP-4-amino-4,6-dideoxygalactose transaminase